MTELQTKAIDQIITELKSFDTYPMYKALSNEFSNKSIEPGTFNKIIQPYQREMEAQLLKVKNALAWAEALKNEIK